MAACHEYLSRPFAWSPSAIRTQCVFVQKQWHRNVKQSLNQVVEPTLSRTTRCTCGEICWLPNYTNTINSWIGNWNKTPPSKKTNENSRLEKRVLSGVNLISKLIIRVLSMLWSKVNQALRLDVASQTTTLDKLECLMSTYHGYDMLKFVYGVVSWHHFLVNRLFVEMFFINKVKIG